MLYISSVVKCELEIISKTHLKDPIPIPPIVRPHIKCPSDWALHCNKDPTQKTTKQNLANKIFSKHGTALPHAKNIEIRREYLSANVPARSAPASAPSSSMAAASRRVISPIYYVHSNITYALIRPISHGLACQRLRKSFITEHVGDHTLVISEKQAAYGSEDGARQRKVVVSKTWQPAWPIRVLVSFPVR